MTVPSDPIQPGYPSPLGNSTSRPGTVTISGYLLYAIGLLALVGVVTALASYPTIRDAFADAYKDTPMANSAGAVAIAAVAITIVSAVLFGGGAMVLAPLILRGKQPARIITWVLCGLVICCQGAGLASSGMSGASFGQTNTQGVDAEELQRRLTEGVPDWVRPAELASGGLMVVLALVVVIMLALPASHPFFRKQPPEQQWTPPAYPTV